MAIPYGSKLGESTTASTTVNLTTSAQAKAGSLVVVAFGGKAGSSLSASSVTIGGTAATLHQRASSLANVGVAWLRITSALASGSTITIVWNTAPTVSWLSAHSFEGASGTATNTSSNSGVSTTATSSVTVSGNDWLTVGVVGLPYDYGIASETGANSSTLRDDNARTSAAPWLQMSSRNGTSGSTHAPGVVYQVSVDWYAVAVSWPYQAMPTGGGGQNSGLWAV